MIVAAQQIQPLCDQCHQPMKATRFGGEALEFNAHLCENDDCQQRVFRIDRGYFNIVGGQVLADKVGLQTCPACEHDAKMYLLTFKPATREGLWRCAQVGCGHEQLMIE